MRDARQQYGDRTVLRMLEDEQDCTCRMVQSGEAALSAAKKCRPDILVIDAVLPLMDGLGVIDRLKEVYGERMPQRDRRDT